MTAFASFVTEAQRVAVQADVAFMNVHGIRKDIAAGPMTKRELFEALPFRNVLTTFQLSGKELRHVLDHAVRTRPAIYVTGVTGSGKKADGSVVWSGLRVGSSPIDDQRRYSCTASDYFVGRPAGISASNLPALSSCHARCSRPWRRPCGPNTTSSPVWRRPCAGFPEPFPRRGSPWQRQITSPC